MKKNVSGQKIGAQMVSATDGSAFTGSVTVYVTGDAGTQAIGSVGSGVCTHEGNGYHTYAPSQGETNYDLIAFTFIGTGAVPVTLQVFPTFPQTGDNFARLGAPAGASIAADLVTIAGYVDDIGAAGAGLTAVPYNPAWDAEIQSEVTDALNAYDPPTKAELDTHQGVITTAIAALNDLSEAEVNAQVDAALADYDAPTKAEMDAAFAALNDLSAAEVNAEVDQALADYDPATAADVDAAETAILAVLATIAGYLDTEIAAIKAKTDQLFFTGGGVDSHIVGLDAAIIDAASIATDAFEEFADTLLNRNVAGGSNSGRLFKHAAYRLVNRVKIQAGTLTVYGVDDSTSAFTQTVTTTAGNPISEVDTD